MGHRRMGSKIQPQIYGEEAGRKVPFPPISLGCSLKPPSPKLSLSRLLTLLDRNFIAGEGDWRMERVDKHGRRNPPHTLLFPIIPAETPFPTINTRPRVRLQIIRSLLPFSLFLLSKPISLSLSSPLCMCRQVGV